MLGRKMHFTDRESTLEMSNRLRSSLSDEDIIVGISKIGSLYNQEIWVIEVTKDKQILVFNPFELDNGASGIDLDKLIYIRRTFGEDIPLRPVKSAQFSDMNTLG
jgi:hypothetical protein